MMVFDERIDGGFAGDGTNSEDGEFAGEGDEAFEDQRDGGKFLLGFRDVFGRSKNPLAFAIVAEAAGFQDGGEAELFHGGVEFLRFRDGNKFGGGDAEFLEELLFVEAILRGFEGGGRGIDGDALGEKFGGVDGNVFEFVGDQFEAGGEFFERGEVVKIGGDTLGDAADGSFGRRIEKTEVQPQRIAGEGQHVAELSAAEDADGHARFPCFFADEAADGSGCARTRPVCSLRNFRTASRTSRCFAPRMAAARSAALTAPDLPMESVPTGMPPGICAMERSESRPFKAFDSTGTPRTGRTVFEAVMPGRCAAPPAPAMMTSMPRFSAVSAYSKSRSGVRWAETIRVSCGTPSSLSVLEANFMVSQSEPEPMMMPTRGWWRMICASFLESWRFFNRRARYIVPLLSDKSTAFIFDQGVNLGAVFPVVAELADEIERAGDENGVIGGGFGEGVVEGLFGFGDDGKTGGVVAGDFGELRGGDRRAECEER